MRDKLLNREDKTVFLLPAGDAIKESIIGAFKGASLDLVEFEEGSYLYCIRNLALPLLFQLARSKEVLASINAQASKATIGITSTDIAREQNGAVLSKIPLFELNPTAVRPYLSIGATPNLSEKIAKPTISDISGSVYTSYPNTLKSEWKGARSPTIVTREGKIEGYWVSDAANQAIVDIVVTGNSAKKNRIREIQPFYPNSLTEIDGKTESVVWVVSPSASSEELRIAQRLIDILNAAAIRK